MATGMEYYQLMPEKIYQVFDTVSDLLKPTIKGYSDDYLKEIISIIAYHIQKSKGTAPLKIEYLKKLVPQGDRYLMGLIDIGIVQRSGYAVKGQSSFKYCFTPEYFSKYISLSMDNAKLKRRIELARDGFRKEASLSIRNRSEQVKYLRELTIVDDYEEFLLANYSMGTEQYNDIEASAKRILNGDIFWSIDNTSGRFHSNVTNMAKGLRPYLRIKGEPLVNIDIKNSQPYLSSILLTDPGKVSYLAKNTAFALMLQSLKVSLNQDVKTYISLVISGQLYEYLMQEFAKEGQLLTRNETKQQVLRILFARNRMPKDETNRKARHIFNDRFPTVNRIFSKVRGSEKGDRFSNYKRFAILLQRIESYLMLDVILKRIYRELPGTIAITVHDSIMTGALTNNVEAVRKILTEELTFFVGFRPQTKIEGLKQEEEGIIEEGREVVERRTYSNQYDATNLVCVN